MQRIFEWIGGFALIAFSFYFTDRVSLLVANRSELMQEIKQVSASYEIDPVDAEIHIKENTMIPGKFGRKVNSEESYLSMHDFGSFNANYLVFEPVKPEVSIKNNKDKFITSGNSQNRQISFIIKDNKEIENYFIENEINYNKVIEKLEDKTANVEFINGANEKSDFNSINSGLKDYKKLCLKGNSNIDLCKKNSYYLIDTSLQLTMTNIIEIKNNISPGSIILISSGAKLENLKLLLNEIEYKDLQIVHLSKLINEESPS